ncbi:MAG TPA: hypothetical protein DEA55_09460 [Rhodospirillaceae bacterium]|nr:hypothetical protein [Rhodospirillaceae bacterium]
MTGVSTLGQALAQIERFKSVQERFSDLSTQLATGKRTQKFTGLGADILTSKRSRADIKSLDAYVNNVMHADRRIKTTLNTVEEFKKQAENFAAALAGFTQQGTHQKGDIVYYDDPLTPGTIEHIQIGQTSEEMDVDFKTLQDMARKLYTFMVNLVNQQDGDRYILAGAETTTQPLVDSGTLDTAISSLLTDWKNTTLTTTQLISGLRSKDASVDPNAITDSLIGYSAPLSSGTVKDVFVRADDNTELNYTALANEPAFRDVIVALAYFKNENLTPMVDEIDPATMAVTAQGAPGTNIEEMKENFYEVFNNMAALVNNAIDDIDSVRYELEGVRARIAEIMQNHKEEQNLLVSAVDDVENVDINEVAVEINTLRVQLDASFRVTARLQELSLVNFI